MNDKDRIQIPRVPAASAPRKRFRLEKLEERIAPKKKGGGGSSASGTSRGVSMY